MILTQRELAALFRVDVRTIQRWGHLGLDDTRVDGAANYDAPAAVAWRAQQLLEEERRKHARSEREELELEKLRHQNREARIKADLAESKAVPLVEAVELFVTRLSAIRAALLRVPVRYGDLVRPDDPTAGEDALEELIDRLLGDLQQALDLPALLADGETDDG